MPGKTKLYGMIPAERPWISLSFTGLWESKNFCNHSVVKLHEAFQMFRMVDHVRWITSKKSCKSGEFGSFKHVFLLSNYTINQFRNTCDKKILLNFVQPFLFYAKLFSVRVTGLLLAVLAFREGIFELLCFMTTDYCLEWAAPTGTQPCTVFGCKDFCGCTVLGTPESVGMNGQIDWQAQQISHLVCSLGGQRCSEAWGTFLTRTSQSITALIAWRKGEWRKEAAESPPPSPLPTPTPSPPFRGLERSVFNQTNIGTVSRATLGRQLRDGAEPVWAFPSATMPSWAETESETGKILSRVLSTLKKAVLQISLCPQPLFGGSGCSCQVGERWQTLTDVVELERPLPQTTSVGQSLWLRRTPKCHTLKYRISWRFHLEVSLALYMTSWYKKRCARWVPDNSSEEQKRGRVDWCTHMLRKFDGLRCPCVWDLVTGDETWVF